MPSGQEKDAILEATDRLVGQSEDFGVALSGGGVRASLFALGSLLYLADSGLNRRVCEISSVSGGSVTNAFIAQRCNFADIDADAFDKHAEEFSLAVTRGLVPRSFVVFWYGLLSILVFAIVIGSWPVALPWWADALLLGALGAVVLLRGFVLAKLLDARLFGRSSGTLGDLSGRKVNHIFCATDLNSSHPIYLTTIPPHVVSPAWGISSDDRRSGSIRLTTAVRASAAFPGGLPPKKLRTDHLGLTPSVGQYVTWHSETDFADMARPRPTAIYLADGGVWNNIGTDWFLPSTRQQLPGVLDPLHKRARRFIVIDASAPTVRKRRLWYLAFPWLAEAGSIARVLKALYASTVMARIDVFRAREDEVSESSPGDCVALARLVERTPWKKPDEPVWPVPGWFEQRPLLRWRAAFDRRGFEGAHRWFWRECADLHTVNSIVPTTLFRLRPQAGLGLLIQGYAATRAAMLQSGLANVTNDPTPALSRFTHLVGLSPARVGEHWCVSSSGVTPSSAPVLRVMRSTDRSRRTKTEVISATWAAENVQREAAKDLASWREARQAQGEHMRLVNAANAAYQTGAYQEACERYTESEQYIGQPGLTALELIRYSIALGRCGDPRGLAVTRRAQEQVIKEEAFWGTWIWYQLSQAYAVNQDTNAAVNAFSRTDYASHPKAAQLLSGESAFDAIREDPAFAAYLATLGSAASKNDSAK